MTRLSRGFRGHRSDVDPARLPPGQYLVTDFPVLSAGPTPRTPLDQWSFTIRGAVETPASWTWEEFLALPAETPMVDIHCVTKWSKLDTSWKGVSLDTLLEAVGTKAKYLVAFCDGGYTTNLPLADLTSGQAWIAYEFAGAPLDPIHGGPARLLVPHLARARLTYGEWLRRENRRVDAREQLRVAYDMFASMGAEGFADRARRELLATGEKVRKRRDDTRDELTPQEEQIARLAREGRTNPEIGAELYLSPRTVEWHLRKVFGKLGISSRKGLYDALPSRDREAAPV
jgi:DMSO/TMAO reductase YedYZ molybdopterin-dependent catalytic subunit